MPAAESAKPRGTGPADPFPQDYLAFLAALLATFEPRRGVVLAERDEALAAAHAGRLPGYLPDSEALRGSWRIEPPDWALDQRNQITGPADNAKLLVGMCNSGAPGCMPDGEDSITTDWTNVLTAQRNTVAAIRGELTCSDPETGETRRIKPGPQLLFYRPRGLRLEEANALQGRRISASILDLSRVFFETAGERRAAAKDRGLRPRLCFYIPKVESAKEALWWSDLIAAMEDLIRIPAGSTKIMFLIESLPAAYQAEEILHASRRHALGLNLGRWDYMASLLHHKLADPSWILPDRNTIPHDIPFFQNLRYRLVDVCHRRGALAIGGMTALFPNRKDPALNERALKRLAEDKRNEAAIGFDGAWTGHPDQQETAVRQFPAPNQLGVVHPNRPRQPDLVPSPAGAGRITASGTRDAIRTVVEYRFGILSGLGARLIPGYDPRGELIGGFMEDLATDRIYRLMLAQRLRHGVATEDGTKVTAERVSAWFDSELEKLLAGRKDEADREKYRTARKRAEAMILNGEF